MLFLNNCNLAYDLISTQKAMYIYILCRVHSCVRRHSCIYIFTRIYLSCQFFNFPHK